MAKAEVADKPGKLARKIAKLERSEMAHMFRLLEKHLRKRAKKDVKLSSTYFIVAHSCHTAEDALTHPIRPNRKK